ncbi:MAG: hypothetical protein COV44_05450 [Deltaproteobacteria bacterium CG11_big_fil_rev_8_21_14_0_20_45_16]|nr:MAG: hypothetical protein COV44_05450 [Deltaproteobacteria bacterium CG11_big_fil_rev_8_21_14_0_20_45_16]
MKCNVGKSDRAIRFVVGLCILGAGFYFHSYLGLIGLVPLLTALLKFCPLYLPFKIST